MGHIKLFCVKDCLGISLVNAHRNSMRYVQLLSLFCSSRKSRFSGRSREEAVWYSESKLGTEF